MVDLLLQRLSAFIVENGRWFKEEDEQRPFKTTLG
jgi:hypothetical protein